MRFAYLFAVFALASASAPALALDGLAPAGPCAEEDSGPRGPVARLFSPQNVASGAGPGWRGSQPAGIEGVRSPRTV